MAVTFQVHGAFRAPASIRGTAGFSIPYSVAEIDAAKRMVLERNGQRMLMSVPSPGAAARCGRVRSAQQIHLAIAHGMASYFDPEQRSRAFGSTSLNTPTGSAHRPAL